MATRVKILTVIASYDGAQLASFPIDREFMERLDAIGDGVLLGRMKETIGTINHFTSGMTFALKEQEYWEE
ncbi:hypothetical protein CMI37_08945 [Candidatus Pacearchaeota archaeon]|nr:hypothetical protein [Candidatus Pacearchaeota archaeon]